MRKKLSFLQKAEPLFLSKTSSTINIILPKYLCRKGIFLQRTKRPLSDRQRAFCLFGQGAVGSLHQQQQLFLGAGGGVDIAQHPVAGGGGAEKFVHRRFVFAGGGDEGRAYTVHRQQGTDRLLRLLGRKLWGRQLPLVVVDQIAAGIQTEDAAVLQGNLHLDEVGVADGLGGRVEVGKVEGHHPVGGFIVGVLQRGVALRLQKLPGFVHRLLVGKAGGQRLGLGCDQIAQKAALTGDGNRVVFAVVQHIAGQDRILPAQLWQRAVGHTGGDGFCLLGCDGGLVLGHLRRFFQQMVGEGSVVDEGGIAGEAVLQLAQAVVAVGVDGKGRRVFVGRLQLLDGQAAVLQRAGKVIQLDAQAVGKS